MLVLPLLAMLVVGLLEVAGLVRDVLLAHEAARAGVRVAATTTGTEEVVSAARDAAPELDLETAVSPSVRGDGDIAIVDVTAVRDIGPVSHEIHARAFARVEPAVGTTPSAPPP